ncbi:unnamed protein product [Somion occarium]|uniref:BZIP domain-containing protein n=1 Tax=Somion occarium TaxID=3059160 RepID=A0ABP1DI01_9APHY
MLFCVWMKKRTCGSGRSTTWEYTKKQSQSAPSQTVAPTTTVIAPDATTHPPPPPAPQPPGTFQTLRLRDEPPPVTQPSSRTSRKRKSPPNVNPDPQQLQPQPPPGMHQPPPGMLPPGMVHPPPPHMGGPPLPHHAFSYIPTDYSPGGMPPPQQMPPGPPPGQQADGQPSQAGGGGSRALSQSKRAEQNRKAQRAFRERRDQHVKALESRSQLLDAALASADEANRRWEECRALVDQLRVENAALRAALSQAQMMNGSVPHGTEPLPPLQEQTNAPPKEVSNAANNEKPNESQQ